MRATVGIRPSWPGPQRSLERAVRVSKRARRKVRLALDYVGFELEDGWVVGFGMDLDGAYRELDHLAVVEAPGQAGAEPLTRPPGAP